MWVLSVLDAGEAAQVAFRILPGTTRTIGRAAGADFIIDSGMASRVHCRLSATDDVLEVEDLDSTNGTYVNEQRIDRARLQPGDRIRIGRLELTVDRVDAHGPP